MDRKSAKESQIFLALHYRGKKIKVYTGKKIQPSMWDLDTCRANPRKYRNNCVGFNRFLQDISDQVETLVNDNKPITKGDIRLIVDKALGKETKDSFFGFAESHLEEQRRKGQMKPISIKGYQMTINKLRSFRPTLTFDEVDLNFYDKFVAHLRDASLATNTIGAHIKRLKWILTSAMDRDVHTNVAFKKKAFKVIDEETDSIYLTKEEIEKLASKELAPKLRRVADAFVINCYLGMRYSDLVFVQRENFTKEGNLYYLDMVQGKTKEKVTIPINPEVVPILEKYDFAIPVLRNNTLMSVQKFNMYLKEAAQKAEINSLETVRLKGKVEKIPKYKLIKSHTARRSFSTNLYLDGVPIQDIMAITGHSKEQTFLLYVKADQLTKSKGLARHYTEGKKA
ncbi:MAG: site-specific integrase [Bacteroidetes bacterium]|nr:site-specific integrase [Bacteroidota bacterium]